MWGAHISPHGVKQRGMLHLYAYVPYWGFHGRASFVLAQTSPHEFPSLKPILASTCSNFMMHLSNRDLIVHQCLNHKASTVNAESLDKRSRFLSRRSECWSRWASEHKTSRHEDEYHGTDSILVDSITAVWTLICLDPGYDSCLYTKDKILIIITKHTSWDIPQEHEKPRTWMPPAVCFPRCNLSECWRGHGSVAVQMLQLRTYHYRPQYTV